MQKIVIYTIAVSLFAKYNINKPLFHFWENGGKFIEYHISTNMAKELSMLEENAKGKQKGLSSSEVLTNGGMQQMIFLKTT